MKETIDVTISIANWNRADFLEECLRSVFATPLTLEYEVIVVDNASSDHSVAVVRQQFPQIQLIENQENVGFGRAHNQAMARARGRYVLLLNNDATVWPDSLSHLVWFMDEHPQAGACGCPDYRQTVLTTFMAGACRSFPSLSRTLWENIWRLVRPPIDLDAYPFLRQLRCLASGDLAAFDGREVAWVVGALLMLRKQALDEIGGFDEQFFLFAEETDLCRRLWDADWKVLFTTSTSYAHHGGASSQLRSDIERLRGESGEKYFRKHHGSLAAWLFRIQHYLLCRWLLQGRVWLGKQFFPSS